MDVLSTFFKVKIKVGGYIDFVDKDRITDLEHERVLEGLIVTLRYGEDCHVFHCAGVKLRGANQITHIFQNHQVGFTGIQTVQTLAVIAASRWHMPPVWSWMALAPVAAIVTASTSESMSASITPIFRSSFKSSISRVRVVVLPLPGEDIRFRR